MVSATQFALGFVTAWVVLGAAAVWFWPPPNNLDAFEAPLPAHAGLGPRHPLPGALRGRGVARLATVDTTTALPTTKASRVIELTLTDPRVLGARIRIRLTPDISGPISAEYMEALAALGNPLATASLHRAEPQNLVQGRVDDRRVAQIDARGPCPPGIDEKKVKSSYCDCGCNGPIMRRGMVAWAGGNGHGPDFFIFTGPDGQGDAWIHDHTVWGVLADEESFATMDKIYELPTVRSGPATLLADDSGRQATVPFNMSLAA